MADKKISDMTALAAGSQATGDLLPVVDISETAAGDKNKKMTMEALFQGIPGNVGIGDSTPSAKLEIRGASTVGTNSGHIVLSGDSATVGQGPQIVFSESGSGSSVAGAYIGHGRESSNSIGFLSFGTRSSSNISDTPAERMRIDSSGNVGIGTSSPSANLDIFETAFVNAKIRTSGNNSATLNLQNSAADYSINNVTGGAFTISDGTERLRIDSSGNVGIGTTTPQAELHLNDASGLSRIRLSGGASGADNFEFGQGTTGVTNGGLEIRDVDASATRLVIDGSGNVGIGTTSPSAKLHINGSQQFDWGEQRIIVNYDNSYRQGISFEASNRVMRLFNATADSGGVIAFNTRNAAGSSDTDYGTERMRITSDGKVGIGTGSPTQLLDLNGGASGAYLALHNNTTGSGSGDGALVGITSSGEMRINQRENNDLTFRTNNDERMRISAGGLVGIGTTNPSSKLEINYDATNAGNAGLRLRSADSNESFLTLGVSTTLGKACITSSENGTGTVLPIVFTVGSSSLDERMRINSSGNVGIGTSSPGYKLDVHEPASSTYNYIHITSAVSGSATSDGLLFGLSSSGQALLWNQEETPLRFATDNTERLRIDESGNVGIGTTSPARPLEVSSSQIGARFTSSSSDSQIEVIDSSGTVVFGSASGEAIVQTGGAERLRVDFEGRVGIGTTNPSNSLQINTTNPQIRLQETGSGGSKRLDMFVDPTTAVGVIAANQSGQGLAFQTTNSERMRINSVGNVGIGTTSPRAKVDFGPGTGQGTLNQTLSNYQAVFEAPQGTGNISRNIAFAVATGGICAAINATDQGANKATGLMVATGTANSIAERLRIDSVGNVGIGTVSPSGLMHLAGSAASLYLEDTDSSNTLSRIYKSGSSLLFNSRHTSAGQFVFNSEDSSGTVSERMRIDSSGRVIIGGTSPGQSSADELTLTSSADTGMTIRSGTSSGGSIFFSDTTSGAYQYAGYIQYDHATNYLAFGANTNEGMRIDSSGRVLIGTTSASSISSSANNLVVQDTAGEGGITIVSSTTDASNIFFADTAGAAQGQIKYQHSGDYMRFYTNATERLRIGSDGETNLYTNTVSRIRTARTSGLTRAFSVLNGASSTSTGTAVMAVNADGDLVNDNNSYGSLSDSKLKENIVDAASQWDDLKALQIRKYNFKAETGRSTHTQIGVIAQEVETVSPGLVENTPDLDNEGNDLGTVTKTVNYSVLYMKAVGALQEAMNRIETLEAKVAALEAG